MLGMFIMVAAVSMTCFIMTDDPAWLEFASFMVANVFMILAYISEWRLRDRIEKLESEIEKRSTNNDRT